MLTDEHLNAIQGRRAAITDVPWRTEDRGGSCYCEDDLVVVQKDGGELAFTEDSHLDCFMGVADAMFVASAPADIDALVAEVDRLRLNLEEIAGGDPTLGAYFKTLAKAALDGAGVE